MRYINIDRDIDRHGSSIEVNVTSSVTYSDWGDEDVNSSSVSTVAIVNDIDGDEDFNKDGVFVPGDKVFFFKSTETGLAEDSTVTFDSIKYNIVKVISHKWHNTSQQHEVRCKRIN